MESQKKQKIKGSVKPVQNAQGNSQVAGPAAVQSQSKP